MARNNTFNYELVKSFVSSRKAMAAAFIWGFCEATFFFVVPDFYFMFTALFLPARGIIHGLLSILGTVAGGIIMYKLGALYPQAMNIFLLHIPGISKEMIAGVVHNLDTFGLKALFLAPFSGAPYKIYAILAGSLNLSLLYLVLLTIPSRLSRIAISSLCASAIGRFLHKAIRKNARSAAILYVLFWIGFYSLYVFYIKCRY